MAHVSITVNGKVRSAEVEPGCFWSTSCANTSI